MTTQRINKLKNRKAQEEMVGFALIMVIVGVILLIFLAFSMNRPQVEGVESYEVQSFMQAFLQHHTTCEDNLEYLTMQKLLSRCKTGGNNCLDGRTLCGALREESQKVLEQSWNVGGDRPEKGFNLLILNEETNTEIIRVNKGNVTNNYKGTTQYPGSDIQLVFNVYY